MTRASDYLHRADEAEAKATQATGEYRTQLLALAEQWRDLARQAEALAEHEARATRQPGDPPRR